MGRPYRQEISDLRPAPEGLWLVVHAEAMGLVGALPIVAFGRFEQVTEYAHSSRWMPCVLQEYTVVDAESVPGAMGVIMVRGGEPPTEELLRSLIEEENGNG